MPLLDHFTIPDYELSNPDGTIVTSALSQDDLLDLMTREQFQGYSIMSSMAGTPEQLWEILK